MLTHEAYLDALQAMRSTTPEWRATFAGFLVLRLIDTWLDDDGPLVSQDTSGLYAVHEALSGVEERDLVRPMLTRLVEIITQSERVTPASVEPTMIAYGRALFQREQWALALDVFASLLSHSLASHDDGTAVSAAIRLAFVLKELGQLEAAQSAYSFVFHNSGPDNRAELYWLGQISFSDLYVIRGQFKEADAIVHIAAQETKKLGLIDLYEDAIYARCSAAAGCQNYHAAARIGQANLARIADPYKRQLLQSNVGAAFVGGGNYYAAKQILVPLLEYANTELTRQNVLLNLLEVAVEERDQRAFEHYNLELRDRLVRPMAQANYNLFVARNFYTLGNLATARESWQQALSIASDNGLSQLHTIIQAEILAAGQRTGT